MADSLAQKLAEARAQAGLSLREIEALTGIRNAHLSQIETGRIERPEPSLLFDLATVLEIDYTELLRLAGHATGPQQGRNRALTAAALRAVGLLRPEQQAKTLDYIAKLTRGSSAEDAATVGFGRDRIVTMAEQALRLSDAADHEPTNLEDVALAVGVKDGFQSIDALPQHIVDSAVKPPWWGPASQILGAAVFPSREVFVDRGQIERRQRFTAAHEIGHLLLPWHGQLALLDDEQRLFFGTREDVEEEANWAAAHLIFQGPERFFARAGDYPISLAAPQALAERYRASMHATIRYYAEHHHDQVAVLIAGRYRQFDGTLPIWNSIQSATFREHFGRFGDHVGSLVIEGEASPLGQLAAAALQQGVGAEPLQDAMMLTDRDGDVRRFTAEAFFNGYSMFVFVARRRANRRDRPTDHPSSPRR